MEDKNTICRELLEGMFKQLEGMLKQLEGDCQCDQATVDHLRIAQKSLAQCGNPKRQAKQKRTLSGAKMICLHALLAIWNKVLYRYTTTKAEADCGFEKAFTMDGEQGYKKFFDVIKANAFKSLEEEESLSREEVQSYKTDFEKSDGWLQNLVNNMAVHVWDYLLATLKEQEIDCLGSVAYWKHRRELLVEWSNQLKVAKSSANAKYSSKVVQFGDVSIASPKVGTRPSRCLPNVRTLHFLEPNQVEDMHAIGSGIQGEVMTCHILGCPLIPKNVILVAKRFNDGSRQHMRASALQEVLIGGLNHRGVVGALRMTIEDPPRLIYDRYNGGDLDHFIKKCDRFRKSNGKWMVDDNFKFIAEKKVFLGNRLGIAFALLETMQFLHSKERVHCDLHGANVLLHFDYNDDYATKVYVGMCDFGLAKNLAQCAQPENRIWKTPLDQVAQFRMDYPHMAPELVGQNLAQYSKATDIYAMGNMFETLLQAKDHWDDMSPSTHFLQEGWIAQNDACRLDGIIKEMMHKDPKKRLDCAHLILKIYRAFPECRLRMQNSEYLRD